MFFRSILYGVFAVIIAQQFGSQTAGVIVSMLALVQLLVWDPLSG
ncbi:MAG: hypothetical protein U9Q15_03065 [Patescibacteria group bacterium]|nr:hypothetical protein [Patescibacteria group bacterium]